MGLETANHSDLFSAAKQRYSKKILRHWFLMKSTRSRCYKTFFG